MSLISPIAVYSKNVQMHDLMHLSLNNPFIEIAVIFLSRGRLMFFSVHDLVSLLQQQTGSLFLLMLSFLVHSLELGKSPVVQISSEIN